MKAYKQIIPPMEMQRIFITFLTQVDNSKFAGIIFLFDSLMLVVEETEKEEKWEE